MNQLYVDAARRYAESDRSDPFAFNRAYTHLQNGVAGTRQIDGEVKGSTGNLASYNANFVNEEVSSEDGPFAILGEIVTFNRTGYRNIVRP